MLTSDQIRKRYIDFFKERGHQQIPSAPLVPENDPSVLFTTAGMHPLVPFLMGQAHPGGKRLVNAQKCIRTQDIDEVGDATHDTFFEMLGNWSLGDYFKEEAIRWSFAFLTDPEKGLGLSPDLLAITVYEGDEDVPVDQESIETWMSLGIPRTRIFLKGRKDNWWGPPGETGPCGPDTEMFVYLHSNKAPEHVDPTQADSGFVEVWNNVFMQYRKETHGTFAPLPQKNVDTGMGLERVTMILQGKNSIFDTDLFSGQMNVLNSYDPEPSDATLRAKRIVADHIRAATFIFADGVQPSNVEQGYILRRLIRRAIRYLRFLPSAPHDVLHILAEKVIEKYADVYPELQQKKDSILQGLSEEVSRFQQSLERGLKAFQVISDRSIGEHISGQDAFDLFTTYGFPLEMTVELAREQKRDVDERSFWEHFQKHQETSRQGATQKFHGGLADHSPESTRLHTATHLLHMSLKKILGAEVEQKGSNITPERLRFDFNYAQKLTPEQLQKVEDMVNEHIQRDLTVTYEDMPIGDARGKGVIGLFEEKYGDKVRVYTVGDFSQEICGGPHVTHTGELGHFTILKEESCGAGLRRIKATVSANIRDK